MIINKLHNIVDVNIHPQRFSTPVLLPPDEIFYIFMLKIDRIAVIFPMQDTGSSYPLYSL